MLRVENVYAELARRCGLAMPATRHFDLDRRLAAFGAERFDREDGMRVPVHTLAGLLHADFRLPSVDYSTFLRATRLMTRDQRQVDAAFQRCVFNVLFNDRTAVHAGAFAPLARDAPIRAATVRTISRAIGANSARMISARNSACKVYRPSIGIRSFVLMKFSGAVEPEIALIPLTMPGIDV